MTLVQDAGRSPRRWGKIALIVVAVILAIPLFSPIVLRTFLFHPFYIPARSMMPTLLEGDNLFVSKYAYGYSRYSLPFSPRLFSGRIFGSMPERGDVVVFRMPKNDSVDYIKRIVGLPGDTIQMQQGLLFINGVSVQRERLVDFAGDDPCGTAVDGRTKRWREILLNGVSYETLDCVDNGFYDNTSVYKVPDGHIFVLGDNRDNSTDSRVLSAVGYIPLVNIVGRAGLIYFSRTPGADGNPSIVRSERIGMLVH
ncbi:signal peptidase I [Bradyrhizobium sp. 200]|uniref:signal peptidase I n=1 Tax=Bradyrhizobium sp. 200 TaxID=2782665 RepID=UPI001FFF51B0|nr:signal peptidase I [Bradyrhizobium sp. 200]UPJ52297.1 signal peptidase I [Bradyrhizobium sp. 200]